MLRACAIDFGGSWDSHLPLVDFAYNNNYHSSIDAPPFELLYGWRCRTPVSSGEVRHRVMGWIEVVLQTTEKLSRLDSDCIPLRVDIRAIPTGADQS